jgi:hypothetical protein
MCVVVGRGRRALSDVSSPLFVCFLIPKESLGGKATLCGVDDILSDYTIYNIFIIYLSINCGTVTKLKDIYIQLQESSL